VIYLLIIDADTQQAVNFGDALVNDQGEYQFGFNGVPEGRYELAAGTDLDNDFFICDPGEACGQYLTLDQPLRIEVDRNRRDLDFMVGFSPLLPAQSVAEPGQGAPAPTGYRRSSP